MLTLVYDGLKKTNERTRIEAFMEQVHDRFKIRLRTEAEAQAKTTLWQRLMAR
jgi:hypothetical protein